MVCQLLSLNNLFSVYVMLGQPYEFVGLMDHLQDRGLLDTGEYFVVGVHLGQYDPLNPQYYFQGKLYTTQFNYLSNRSNVRTKKNLFM